MSNEMSQPSPIARELREHLLNVIEMAKDAGYVVTIELIPRHPPAIGNYFMSPTIRIARTDGEYV